MKKCKIEVSKDISQVVAGFIGFNIGWFISINSSHKSFNLHSYLTVFIITLVGLFILDKGTDYIINKLKR